MTKSGTEPTHNDGVLLTIKELAIKFQREETEMRTIIGLFAIESAGLGPKPAKGVTAKTYAPWRVQAALDAIKAFKEGH